MHLIACQYIFQTFEKVKLYIVEFQELCYVYVDLVQWNENRKLCMHYAKQTLIILN